LDGQLEDISGSIREAARLFRQMRAMLASERDDPTDLRLCVWQLGVLMRPAVERTARVVLDVLDRPCFVDVPRWQLVHAVGALVHESIRRAASSRVRSRIHLEMYLQDDDIAVLEVKDDVSYAQSDALSFVTSRLGSDQDAIGLSVLGARVRQIGGELLVDTHPQRGTAVRVFFPLAEAPRRHGSRRRLRSVS
jgi:C4-dicarboxylate-specific signal transduction histidine kinase